MLHLISAGQSWENAFEQALAFLQKPDGVLLFGPQIGESAKEWLAAKSLAATPLRLGARVQDWQEWVKGKARSGMVEDGLSFRFLTAASQRDIFRKSLQALVSTEGFYHLQNLWEEERFFSGLLACVEEARRAGLVTEEVIGRAESLLGSGTDGVTREGYHDFWQLLKIYDSALKAAHFFDFASVLPLVSGSEAPLFFLGFDHMSLLETELVQALAKNQDVFLPVALSGPAIEEALAGKGGDSKTAAWLRALVTNFPGRIEKIVADDLRPVPGHFLLDAHAPSEEARAAAAFAAQCIGEGRELRLLLSREAQLDQSVQAEFREELKLARNFSGRPPLQNPAVQLFLHVLELKQNNFDLTYGLEFARLLSFTQNRFSGVAEKASRAGIRQGLRDWKKTADEELHSFAALLAELDALIPERATPVVFSEAIVKVAELCGIGELARRATDQEVERDAHISLSSLLRNAKVLAASLHGEFSFADWLAEWKAVMEAAPELQSFFPRLQFYSYGEWLPPPEPNSVTIAFGWNAGVEPRRSFSYFFEEGARRKLSEFLLPSQVQEDLSFLDQMERIGRSGTVLFSWSRHDSKGNEQHPSWMAAALPLEPKAWPEVARESKVEYFRADEKVLVPEPKVKAFSASLLERYKECPFRAFAEKILRLEDKMQPLSLDLSPLEEGNIVHRALELFYGRHNGKAISSPEERARILESCLSEAVSAQKIEYFKGSDELLGFQVERLRRMLTDFLSEDARYYEMFPRFRQPEVELVVEGSLGDGLPWKGKIDRVDVDDENRRLVVSDYKLGATTPSSLELDALERFQLQLYLDATEAKFPGYQAAGGLYVSLKTGKRNQGVVRKEYNLTKKVPVPGEVKYFKFGPTSKALKTDEEFAVLREDSLAEARRLALKIRSGEFDVTPLDEETSCKRCEVRPACRIRELRAPAREIWRRPRIDFSPYLQPVQVRAAELKKGKGLNPEQQEAIEREGRLVFIEASAGTGKTTVIVEKIRSFLASRLAKGEASFRAVERFAAISFTEKSAKELALRVGAAIVPEEGMGVKVAAQAIQQISTIHGFCRKLLADFPVEAGIGPMSKLLDERESEALRQEVMEEFFLRPPADSKNALAGLFGVFSRQKIESCVRRLLENRLVLQDDWAAYRNWFRNAEDLGGRLEPGAERERLQNLLEVAEAFCRAYDETKRGRDLLDFNDLEALSLKVLESEKVRAHYRERFDLLLVDEFQDTNSVQRKILERVARPGWSNLFVVGDAKQSIYRFRAADVSVFQSLRAEAEKTGNLVTLSRNYRSRRELVEAANRLSASIFPTGGEGQPFEAVAAQVEAHRETGGVVRIVEFGEEALTAKVRRSEEAEIVAGLVREQLAKGRAAGDIAILLRKISGNEAYLQALTRAGIPFRVGSSKGFYSQQVILDSIALLRIYYGANNDLALLAVLRSPWARLSDQRIYEIQARGESKAPLWSLLGEEEAPLLFAWRKAAGFLSCSELLGRAYENYPLDRREHLQTVKLLAIIQSMEKEGVPHIALVDRLSGWAGWESEDDCFDDSTMPEPGAGGAVQLMTVHAAKGLEFAVTILPDLTPGLLPDPSALRAVPGLGIALKLEDDEEYIAHKKMGELNKEREIAESKRLLYVAVTRAKEELILVMPRPTGKEKKESWAEQLRLAGLAAEKSGWEPGAGNRIAKPADTALLTAEAPRFPKLSPRLTTSISELAAFQFCAEFHRRKFVQMWDDQVVSLWPKPNLSYRKMENRPQGDRAKAAIGALLRRLGIERKERGISLHRVLERIVDPVGDLKFAEEWLAEAYEAQGATADSPVLAELVALDSALLKKFLASEIGRELFGADVKAYPELPFEWRIGSTFLHGTLDRLIQKKDGSWIVADYKSSILEESRDRYRFQVASYMAAISAFASAKEKKPVVVKGFLVDLNEAVAYEVAADPKEAELKLELEIKNTAENYTVAAGSASLSARGIVGGEQCFSCPYSLHCDLGKKIVLEFH